ncbi:MAG: AarF/ABC1/UbiB kinase family protein [Solirubrobacteraceae bacterium]|nr:AarF/ABC1/UbiB kinase family protein [Solirubrobacteraceae bacterium]
MSKDDKIPTGRLRRSSQVGRLAATQAAKQVGTRAANVVRSDEAGRAALDRRQLETAEQIVAALGTMKGAAMKLGQMLSFMDVGLVPEEFREDFQAKLAELRDAAPKVSFKEMRKVIEGEYGEKLDEVFETFDPVPVAAASIGQVYKARLHDGRDVAVKVQYPGIGAAVRADMQNLGLILRLMKGVAPGLDPKALGEEIRERIDEELDYELEASNQRTLARIYDGHPFIIVPKVMTDLSHEKVIVSEFVSGRGFEECKQLPDEERNRIGEIIFRFYFGSMYRHHQFSGDPHPGNSMLLDDGRMAFIDFGLFKRLPKEVADFELTTQRLGIERRGDELIEHLTEGGWITGRNAYEPEEILYQFDEFVGWYTKNEPIELTPEYATRVMLEMSDPRSSFFGKMRHETLPPDHLFGRRLETLTLAVLGQLRATANWGAIAREWIDGSPPVTELGREEAEFYAGVS